MAGTGTAIYNGITFPVPGTYGVVDSSGLSFPAAPGTPVVYLIGNSVGGKPNTVLGPYTSFQAVVNAVTGGDLSDGARFTFKGGAYQVCLYRPYSATQSSLTLKDASGDPSVVLTSVDYGNYTNSLLASISGTPGAIVATVQDNYRNTTQTSPSLGGAIALTYTGNGSAAKVTVDSAMTAVTLASPATQTTGGSIPGSVTVYLKAVPRNASGQGLASSEVSVAVPSGTNTNKVTSSFTAESGASSYDIYASTASGEELYYGNVAGAASGTINVTVTSIPSATAPCPSAATDGPNLVTWLTGASDGSVNLDVSLTSPSVSNCRALAAYLNGQTGYTAVLQAQAGNISSTLIDDVSATSITTTYTLTSDIGAVVNWFNTTSGVTAAAAAGATAAPAAVGLTPFAGGSDGTATTDSWSAAAGKIGTTAPLLRYPVPLTSTQANMLAVNTAITGAATPPGDELCEGFYGGAIGETQAAALANAAALNNRRAIYVGQSDFTDFSTNFVKTSYPGYMAAAYVAGIRAGQAPQMPLTNKQVSVIQLNQTLNATQINTLNTGGVAALTVDNQGVITVSLGTTTDLSSADYNNLYYVEESVGNSVDTLIMYAVQNLNGTFKGQTNYGVATTQAILSEVNAILSYAKDTAKWIAGFTPATTVTPLANNPTFCVVPVTVQVVEPINGIILVLSLEMPLQIAAAA